jgi:hypothetical protein
VEGATASFTVTWPSSSLPLVVRFRRVDDPVGRFQLVGRDVSQVHITNLAIDQTWCFAMGYVTEQAPVISPDEKCVATDGNLVPTPSSAAGSTTAPTSTTTP